MVVLLGIACGWFMGVVFAGVGAHLVPYLARERPGFLARLPATTNFPTLAGIVLAVAFLYWGLIGALLGALHSLSGALVSRSGLGSPNLVFTLGVVALALALGLLLARSLPWARLHLGGLSLLFALLFGWILPLLAA